MAIELLEAKLTGINDDTFHRLGDNYLFFEYGADFDAINPIGQAEGRQKSRGGTPDTSIKLKNGNFVLIQYTTQESGKNRSAFFTKLKGDLEACFDESKTSVPLDKIEQIILCCNSNPEPKGERELYGLCEVRNLKLKIINLSTLAHNIHNKYPFLAKDYLGIELDSNQILPLEKFITEYEKGGFATPLSNPFFFRETELKEISNSLSQHLITVVTGKPGVGKSRLVVEAVKNFTRDNQQYLGYCLRNKDLAVLYDLRRYLSPGKSYLIYIDDANQNITQLTELLIYHSESQVDLKIILTVREYVYNEVQSFIKTYSYKKITIQLFEREALKEIIKAEPFQIKHPLFVQRILAIAHGNARLAIMTAKVAKDCSLHELDNLTFIYDGYFERLAIEKGSFFGGDKLKVLGFIAFFKTVQTDHKETFSDRLNLFNIQESTFWETITLLEEAEFIDVFTDRSTIKISDQILEAYVFYKCFFVEKELDYQILLDHCFPEHSKRISSTIIEVNNTFGHDNLKKIVLPFVLKRYQMFWRTEEEKIKFLSTFWMYMQDETLYYLMETINALNDESMVMLDQQKKIGSENHILFEGDLTLNKEEKDIIFDLLAQYLLHYTNSFESAVLLMLRYMKKRPHLAERLVQYIKSHFTFSYQEACYDYSREKKFSELLINTLQSKEHVYSYLFLRLSPHFLKTNFRTVTSLGYAISFNTIDISLTPTIESIRGPYWTTLKSHFNLFLQLSKYTLKKIIDGFWLDYSPKVRRYDITFIEMIMLNHLDMKCIRDVVLVNEFIQKLRKKKYTSPNFLKLKSQAAIESYKQYSALDWNLYRNKDRFDIEEDNQTFRNRFGELKEKELISTFNFGCLDEYNYFLNFVTECLQVTNWDFQTITKSTDILFKHFIKSNPVDFLSFLTILVNHPEFLKITWPENFAKTLIDNYPDQLHLIEQILQNIKSKISRQKLLIAFYTELPPEHIEEKQYKNFSAVLLKISDWQFLEFKNISNYEHYQTGFLLYHLKLILNRASNGKCRIHLDRNFINKHYDQFSSDSSFIRELYLYLDLQDHHFDYDGETMLFLIEKDPLFFPAYIKSIVNDKKYKREDHPQLKHLWKTSSYIQHITDIFDVFHQHIYFSWEMENVLKDLFDRGPSVENFNKIRLKFMKYYIDRYYANAKRMATCFKVISAKLSGFKDELTIHFLKLNKDLEVFKQIRWPDDGTIVHSGDFNSGLRDEAVYNHLIKLITPLTPKLDYLGHLSYLSLQIDYARRSALIEYKWDFVDHD